MHALVTGGAGFIGSNLVDRLLDDGSTVDVVDDLSSGSLDNLTDAAKHGEALQFHELDVRDEALQELIAKRRPDVIFHLAAQISVTRSVTEPLFDADVNVLGTLQVLEGARRSASSKVLFATSAAIYGDVSPDHLPINESLPHQPASPYGASKASAITYLASYGRLHKTPWCALALANVFGRRQRAEGEAGVVAIFSANLQAGRSSTIFGDGAQSRDFVYVEDVADAFVRAAGPDGTGVLNIGTGVATTVNELYEAMVRACGGGPEPVHVPERPGELRESRLDASRAAELLGWEPHFSLDQGLAALLSTAG